MEIIRYVAAHQVCTGVRPFTADKLRWLTPAPTRLAS